MKIEDLPKVIAEKALFNQFDELENSVMGERSITLSVHNKFTYSWATAEFRPEELKRIQEVLKVIFHDRKLEARQALIALGVQVL